MTLVPNVIANERTYSMPKRCAIAICLDGCEPEYLDVAIAEGLMPNLKLMRETGTDRIRQVQRKNGFERCMNFTM